MEQFARDYLRDRRSSRRCRSGSPRRDVLARAVPIMSSSMRSAYGRTAWIRACARRGERVLDAGCGTGLCGPLLRPYAKRLVGVDLSSGMLERARAAVGAAHLRQQRRELHRPW